MTKTDTIALILAAGRGTRMQSKTPKVLHSLCGKPMIGYVIDAVKNAGIKDIVVVAGYGSDMLTNRLAGTGARIVVQKRLLGSGDAVRTAEKVLKRSGKRHVVIICGDTPLLRSRTLKDIVAKHRRSRASATVLTAVLADAGQYGRIIRKGGAVAKIKEAIEADPYEKDIREVNVGSYCFRIKDLFASLAKVGSGNRKGEYFLTDTIEILTNKGALVESVVMDDAREMTGVNTRSDLAMASKTMNENTLKELMASGVTIEDPGTTIIHPLVKIGRDTTIYSHTVIERDVEIGSECAIGPFARIRSGSRIGASVEIGNFVELVRTRVGDRSKVKHHTYLGDAIIGKSVNIGAGTITANYDGKNKNRTAIGDGAFVGVGSILIAPVKIGARAVIGAGAVVAKNHDVPAGATVVGVPARILRK